MLLICMFVFIFYNLFFRCFLFGKLSYVKEIRTHNFDETVQTKKLCMLKEKAKRENPSTVVPQTSNPGKGFHRSRGFGEVQEAGENCCRQAYDCGCNGSLQIACLRI
jgi:hypothetical protein